MNYELSVVFPTYHRPEEVRRTLIELRENFRIPYEVIIIDNSTKYEKYELLDNEKYIFVGENRGTYSRNFGAREASAPFTLMLDDDSHPLPGAVDEALSKLRASNDDVAGVTSRVERLDGGLEGPPLLPSVFHGCGVLFRTQVLNELDPFYPDDFCFYGEEYYSTLALYRSGYRFIYLDEFRVCHRMCSTGRDKAKILYYLSLNNRRTWPEFVPNKYLSKVMFDTSRRYELIAKKEGVLDAYDRAGSELILSMEVKPMLESQFENFSLLTNFKQALNNGSINTELPVVFCGCGKFPSLWADFLAKAGIPEIKLVDFNIGLVGQEYGDYKILAPDEFTKLVRNGYQFILGHCSRADTSKYAERLKELSANTINIDSGYKL